MLLTSADSFRGSDCYRPLLTPQVLLKYPISFPQCSYIDKQTHLKFLSQIPPHKLINLRVRRLEDQLETEAELMAELVVSLVVQPIVEKAIEAAVSLIKEEVGSVLGVKSEVEKLLSKLTSIKAVLEDAEERQLKVPQLKDWLGKLRNAAYDAEDILETFATQVAMHKRKQKLRRVRTPISGNKISYQYDAAQRIKKILDRLDVITEEKEKFHLSSGVNNNNGNSRNHNQDQELPLTGSFIDTANVFGRDDDKERILHMLLSDEFDEEDDASVIPIIGMPGLGKTTLAQLLFNEERVKEHFESRMWVCVTVDYDLPRILKGMIEFHSKMEQSTSSISLLETRLLEFLTGQRFLLVLDDVWNEDYRKWEPLQQLLKQGHKGSRVLVTSRTARVSQIMGIRSPYLLEYLPEDQCWSIFKRITFNQGNFSSRMQQQNLEAIGREIVGKCKGLPLAVKAIAGFLRKYDDVNKWRKILSSDIWELEEGSSNGPHILPPLKLSYDHLPPFLKHCFSLCSIFPKSYAFDKAEMVKFWMAEALIQSRGGGRQEREEEIGIEYFDELLGRSFFQSSNIDDKVKYQMHDLFHDLAQFVSSPYGHVCQIKDDRSSCSSCCSPETRHVSLLCKHVEKPALSVVENSKKLRTFLVPSFGEHLKDFGRALDKIFHQLKYLRLLDLSSSTLTVLPDSVKELKLLRYLDLSRTEIKVLPNSICNLYNLQTLKLIGCIWIMELPKDLANLVKLRNLELEEMFWFKCSTLPAGIGKLTNLHNLHVFRVGSKSGYRIEELKELPYLTGKLHISKLENAVNGGEAKLSEKESLHKLVLEWSNNRDSSPQTQDVSGDEERLLEDLQPHPNLEELQIFNYFGNSLPQWMRDGRLQNLVSLTLKGCTNCRILSLGQLSSLRVLNIKGMLELEKWPNDEDCRFLGRLKISNCPRLNELPECMPNLRVMKIKKCCSLKALPVTPFLQFLILVDNLELENWNERCLRVIPTSDNGQGQHLLLHSFQTLLEMRAINCPKLRGLPQIFAPQKLEISGCDLLSALPNSEFSQRLQLLALEGCPDGTLVRAIPETSSLNFMILSKISNLDSFPRWPNLPGLKALYIRDCKDLVSLSGEGALQSLTSLNLLSIRGCPKLETLPDEGLPTSLKCLIIVSCSSLKSLGPRGTLKSLNSLKDFYIEDCPLLQSFPEDGLPENLQHLVIQNCPLLKQQCRDGEAEGPEWPKIKDIPDLEIDFICNRSPIMPEKKKASWYRPLVGRGG